MNRMLELLIYLFEKCIHFFEQSAEKLGIPFLIGGFIGALVNRMRKRMTWKKFFASVSVILSSWVAYFYYHIKKMSFDKPLASS